jgi:hypothetical protein
MIPTGIIMYPLLRVILLCGVEERVVISLRMPVMVIPPLMSSPLIRDVLSTMKEWVDLLQIPSWTDVSSRLLSRDFIVTILKLPFIGSITQLSNSVLTPSVSNQLLPQLKVKITVSKLNVTGTIVPLTPHWKYGSLIPCT